MYPASLAADTGVAAMDMINIAIKAPAIRELIPRFRFRCLCFFILHFSFPLMLSLAARPYCNIKKMQEQPTHFSKENKGNKKGKSLKKSV
jgi:hypothetical protein